MTVAFLQMKYAHLDSADIRFGSAFLYRPHTTGRDRRTNRCQLHSNLILDLTLWIKITRKRFFDVLLENMASVRLVGCKNHHSRYKAW